MSQTKDPAVSSAVAQLTKSVDAEKWARLKAAYVLPLDKANHLKHGDRLERQQQTYGKYFDLERWFRYHLRHVRNIGLDAESRPQSVLDIGCGFGLFCRVCQSFGHETLGLDMDVPLYRAAAEALDVTYRVGTVRPFEPLPDDLRGFDVISAIAVKFDQPEFLTAGAPYWTVATWSFWLRDVARRLNEGGRIYLKLHPPSDKMLSPAEIAALDRFWTQISEWRSDTDDMLIRRKSVL